MLILLFCTFLGFFCALLFILDQAAALGRLDPLARVQSQSDDGLFCAFGQRDLRILDFEFRIWGLILLPNSEFRIWPPHSRTWPKPITPPAGTRVRLRACFRK